MGDLATQAPGWRKWLVGGGIVAAAIALYVGWDWLATIGAAGVLLSMAPCLVLCALGVCMKGGSRP